MLQPLLGYWVPELSDLTKAVKFDLLERNMVKKFMQDVMSIVHSSVTSPSMIPPYLLLLDMIGHLVSSMTDTTVQTLQVHMASSVGNSNF